MSRRAASSAKLKSINRGPIKEQTMAIDLSAVNWLYVVIMAVLAFVAALLGSIISFRNKIGAALLAAILFAAGFVAWNYYPHDLGMPIIKTFGPDTPTGSSG
jgi:hypothetical protein